MNHAAAPYEWRTAPGKRRYHLVNTRTGRSRSCDRRGWTQPRAEWGAPVISAPEDRCSRCTTAARVAGFTVTETGATKNQCDPHESSLVQHIHAGYWRDGNWTSWPTTFATRRGFERWAAARTQRGCVVQWRFCAADDEHFHPTPGARPARALEGAR